MTSVHLMFLFISAAHPWASAFSVALFLLSFLSISTLPKEITELIPSAATGLLLDPLHALLPTLLVLSYSMYALFSTVRRGGVDVAQQQQQQHRGPSLKPEELRTLVYQLPLESWRCCASRAHLSVRDLRERLQRRRALRPGVLERRELVEALEGCPHETICSICHEDFSDGESLRLLPCSHYFHCQCVDRWLLDASRAPACPLCATALDTRSVRKTAPQEPTRMNRAFRHLAQIWQRA